MRGKATIDIIPLIEGSYARFTESEKLVANKMLENPNAVINKTIVEIASTMYTSEATITRFCKKLGYNGFNEFKYEFAKSLKYMDLEYDKKLEIDRSNLKSNVLSLYNDYLEIIRKTTQLLECEVLDKGTELFKKAKKIKVYGVGNSAFAAMEMKYRFMRIGYDIDTQSDSHFMKMDAALANEDCLVIGISVTGETTEIVNSLEIAKNNGAKIIAITGQFESSITKIADCSLYVTLKNTLQMANSISSQLPILLIIDILYTEIYSKTLYDSSVLMNKTLEAVGVKNK